MDGGRITCFMICSYKSGIDTCIENWIKSLVTTPIDKSSAKKKNELKTHKSVQSILHSNCYKSNL